jgi:nucleotide-binding universal stress UspA family protein
MWTCPPTRIVVAVDFGEPALAAVRVASTLARRTGATLIAVHAEALEAPPYFTSDQIDALEAQRRAAREVAERQLQQLVAAESGMPVDARVIAGPATNVLVDAAGEADLVVIGTHGRRGPSRWWLGSVAERVARSAPVPVLIVHETPSDGTIFDRVLVLGDDAESAAVRCANLLAAQAGGLVYHAPTAEVADAVRRHSATALVVPRGPDGATGALTSADITLIRDCRLPLLFVPEDTP